MRLTDEQLEALAAGPESAQVERKADVRDAETIKSVRRTLCAFANDLPGHRGPGILIVGLDDAGRPSGIEINQKLLDRLSNFVQDGSIQPRPNALVEVRRLGDVDCAVVAVSPDPAPPVRLNGEVFVRQGGTVTRATPAQERLLAERRRAADLPFDVRPVYAATIHDLDLDRFRSEYLPRAISPDVLRENQRSIEHQLLTHRMISTGSNPVPTVLGLLVIGKDPQFFIPGASVQFVRFDGDDLTAPIADRAEYSGPLLDLPGHVEEKLKAQIAIRVIIEGLRHENRPNYPMRALRELLHNALLHRTYEGTHAPVRIHWFRDYMTITSPGGPYGDVTVQNFGQGEVDYRNRHLAEVMMRLGYVEKLGVGLQIVRRALEENGNPPLEWDLSQGPVKMIVRAAQ